MRTPSLPTDELPLFPLASVLLPGGQLDLRIFEPRYLDLIRDCSANDRGFGICVIVDGDEAGSPAAPASIGTEARIIDFFTRPDGLLGIRVEGGRRFEVDRARARHDGLLLAQVRWREADPALALPPEYGLLATILERIHEHMGSSTVAIERSRYDDASWVGFRLAEAFPLDNAERQLLLQIDEPLQRLDQLMHYLPRFQRD